MKIETLTREFKYNGVVLLDPGAGMDPAAVRTFYAVRYPELVNAVVEGPETKGGKMVYTFKKSAETKG